MGPKKTSMPEIIDINQEIYAGMSIFPGISLNIFGGTGSPVRTVAVFGE